MRKTILRAIACTALVTVVTSLAAQKQNFSYDQLFKGKATNVAKPLPDIRGWADDENYLEMRKSTTDTSKQEMVSVNVKTGKTIPYAGKMPVSPAMGRGGGGGRGPSVPGVK